MITVIMLFTQVRDTFDNKHVFENCKELRCWTARQEVKVPEERNQILLHCAQDTSRKPGAQSDQSERQQWKKPNEKKKKKHSSTYMHA